MEMNELLNILDMPEAVNAEVIKFGKRFDYASVQNLMDGFYNSDTWDEARERLKEVLGADEQGIKMLGCMLHCALLTYDKYIRLGIDREIFTETMKCFTRFINEHYAMTGEYAFDREWWTVRQIAMKLFRIGELEYELLCWEGKKVISIHIPSDAKISDDNCTQSLSRARAFADRYFEDYKNADFICHSWLLSPALKQLLPETSNIIKFQQRFDIKSVDEDAMDFIGWVFKTTDPTLETLPENTSLQRRMKQYLLDGGKVGAALGVIKKGK